MKLREVARECLGIVCGEGAALFAQHAGLGPVEQDAMRTAGQAAGHAGFDWVVSKFDHHQEVIKGDLATQYGHDTNKLGMDNNDSRNGFEKDELQHANHGADHIENSGRESLIHQEMPSQSQEHGISSTAEYSIVENSDDLDVSEEKGQATSQTNQDVVAPTESEEEDYGYGY